MVGPCEQSNEAKRKAAQRNKQARTEPRTKQGVETLEGHNEAGEQVIDVRFDVRFDIHGTTGHYDCALRVGVLVAQLNCAPLPRAPGISRNPVLGARVANNRNGLVPTSHNSCPTELPGKT